MVRKYVPTSFLHTPPALLKPLLLCWSWAQSVVSHITYFHYEFLEGDSSWERLYLSLKLIPGSKQPDEIFSVHSRKIERKGLHPNHLPRKPQPKAVVSTRSQGVTQLPEFCKWGSLTNVWKHKLSLWQSSDSWHLLLQTQRVSWIEWIWSIIYPKGTDKNACENVSTLRVWNKCCSSSLICRHKVTF